MKRILILLLFLPLLAYAQTITKTEVAHDSDMELYFYAAVCDSGTYTSETFKLEKYNSDFATYPLGYKIALAETTADSSVITGVYIYAKTYIGTWDVVDTVFVADTVETSYSTRGVLNLNVATLGVAPEYRIHAIATSALGKTYSLKLSLFAYKPD